MVQGWFRAHRPPWPSLERCGEFAESLTALARPHPGEALAAELFDGIEMPPPVDAEAVRRAVRTLDAALPALLHPNAPPPGGTVEARRALAALHAALVSAAPYLPRRGRPRFYRQPWHTPALILLPVVMHMLREAGHPHPRLARDGPVVGVLVRALDAIGCGSRTLTPGALAQHLERLDVVRRLEAAGLTSKTSFRGR